MVYFFVFPWNAVSYHLSFHKIQFNSIQHSFPTPSARQEPRGISLQKLYNKVNILTRAAAAAAKSLQSCPTLCDPIDGNPPGSPVPGILQARTLEWVAISFSNAWKWKVKVKSLSRVQLLVTPWTAASQAPPSMGFSRQEYWSGVPLPSLNNMSYITTKKQQRKLSTLWGKK